MRDYERLREWLDEKAEGVLSGIIAKEREGKSTAWWGATLLRWAMSQRNWPTRSAMEGKMLSEEEVREAIRRHVWIDYVPEGEHIKALSLTGVEEAAHAIAVAMKERVVWECVGTLSHLSHVSERMSYSTELGSGDFWWAILHGIVGQDGGQYRVYVVKEG